MRTRCFFALILAIVGLGLVGHFQPIFSHFEVDSDVHFDPANYQAPPGLGGEECTCPNPDDELACTKAKQACWQGKINEKQQQANTLSNTLSILNSQIAVQELQVKQTQLEINKLIKDIASLSGQISGLNVSLDHLTANLLERVTENYKRRQTNPLLLLLTSDSIDGFVTKYKYLQIAQKQTTELMKVSETQRLNFDQEKTLKEQKQKEVEQKKALLAKQQAELNTQKTDVQALLVQTKNDEARYQAELEKTLAEDKAIQSVIAGNGDEEKVRDVKEGDTIASIIPGASPCSNGAHLHFEVEKNHSNYNPANYLKSIDGLIWNNSPDGAFGFSGDWNWPLNNPARINQGYGMTWYARVRRAYGGGPHTGIDMISKSSGDYTVKAVKDGVLYRGSIACGHGRLKYVRVEHKDGDISSLYLHVNY
jgi:peptidoglycan hydrolase CwlO-like protein